MHEIVLFYLFVFLSVKLPGSGSDYAPFRDRIGVPFVDIRYTWDSNKMKLSAYPMYHSLYETFYLVDKIMDRGFKYHTAVGQVWIEMTRNLADSLILPFNVSDYASTLMELRDNLLSKFGKMMIAQGINTDTLTYTIQNFTAVVHDFEKRILAINRNDPFDIRKVNDQMMQLDRAFLDPAGLPGRKYKRNLIFTESNVDSYSGSSFPGLVDTLSAIEQGHNGTYQWEVVKKHFSVIIYTIQSAASVLKDVSEFVCDY